MKAALAKLLTGLAKKKLKQKIGQASSLFSNGEYGTAIIALLAPIIPITFIIFIIICAIMLPILLVQQFIQDSQATDDMVLFEKINDMIVLDDWCKDNDPNCEKDATQKYYEELQKVYNEYKKDGVEIDVQLITATIFYANTHRNDIFTEDDEGEITDGDIKLKDISRLAKNMVNGSNIDYEKYNNYLIDTYIPKRFSKLYEDRTDKENAIKEIADEIMGFKNEKEQNKSNNTTNYGSCSYKMGGKEVDTSNLQVVLLSCDGKQELERVDLEDYIKGVVYGEVGNSWPDEVLKAQAVATRSYTLTRNRTMCPGRPDNCEYGYNPNTNEIRMRNCEGDQVYCNYKEGCQKYNYNGYNSLVTGIKNPSMPIYKQPLSKEDAEKFENNLNEVTGKVLKSDNDEVFASAYIDVDQRAWNSMYNENNQLDYNEILVKHYWNKTKTNLTINSNCTSHGSIGDFSGWKQFDPRWQNVNIGSDTLGRSGCLVTSISIQFSRSGTVNLPEFNPGIFANELTKHGGFSAAGGLLWGPLRTTLDQLSNNRFMPANLDFTLSGTKANKINTLKQYADEGYLLVIGVNYEGHWVAVDRVENDKVYIFDPGDSYVNEVSQKYDWRGVTKLQIYKIVK